MKKIKFNKEEINLMKSIAKSYPRFKDKDMFGFHFLWTEDNIKNLSKLNEIFIFFFYIEQSLEFIDIQTEVSIENLLKKIELINSELQKFNFNQQKSEFKISKLHTGRNDFLKILNSFVEENKYAVIWITNLAERLRPTYIKPLSKSVAGVPSYEYSEIETEPSGEDI